MQRTLFDFARKQTGSSATPLATAAATAARRTRVSLTVSPADSSTDDDGTSGAPASKRARLSCEVDDATGQTGLTREAPICLEENSASVVAVDVASSDAPTRETDAEPQEEREQQLLWQRGSRRSREASRSRERQSRARSPPAPSAASGSSSHSTPAAPATSSRWLAALITNPEWKVFLEPITADTWRSGEFLRIERFLDCETSKGKVVLPPAPLIFNAFNSCPFADLKVVLLGQDPYHGLNQAHGLCFSVLPGVPLPPSLKNMYKELATDIHGFQAPTHGYLQSWSEQGMLMLNATLTVEAHNANSHSKVSGWSHFTDAVIARLSQHHPNRLVFLLWGSFAQQKKKLIDTRRHVVIESVHPSPLSASKGWFGCHCFSKCNAALREMGHTPMYWQLPLDVPHI